MDRDFFSKDIYALLLAGGKGVRFWPLSQEDRPKQFLNLFGKDSLLVTTLKRIKNIVPLNQIYIITNKGQLSLLKKQLRRFRFPKKNILLESEGKNTAPAIGWSAVEIKRQNPEAVMIALPCDHLIRGEKYFYKDLIKAVRIAMKDKLVIFGVRPVRAETGYGYIQTIDQRPKTKDYYGVDKFIEKPDIEKAKMLIKNKHYFWNSGIFVWKVDTILKQIKLHSPDLFRNLMIIKDKKSLQKVWAKLQSVSIDVAVLEKSQNVVMIPARFNWQDLGSWQTWSELIKKDKFGNYFRGDCEDSGSKNIDVLNYDKPVVTLGLNDLIIVNTKHGLLVCNKDRTQDIKKLLTFV